MKTVTLPVAYMPLVDAAPLIVAQEMGFAEHEGVVLDLIAAPSWSSVRDMLAFGRVDAAHLLSPVPVAMALGLGGVTTAVAAVSVLSVNGDVIGVGRSLEQRLRAAGYGFDFQDVQAAARALARGRWFSVCRSRSRCIWSFCATGSTAPSCRARRSRSERFPRR